MCVEELILKLDSEGAGRLIAPGSAPVDQFGFWNGERDIDWGGLSLERQEGLLNEVNIGPVGRRGNSDSKIVDVGDNK